MAYDLFSDYNTITQHNSPLYKSLAPNTAFNVVSKQLLCKPLSLYFPFYMVSKQSIEQVIGSLFCI